MFCPPRVFLDVNLGEEKLGLGRPEVVGAFCARANVFSFCFSFFELVPSVSYSHVSSVLSVNPVVNPSSANPKIPRNYLRFSRGHLPKTI